MFISSVYNKDMAIAPYHILYEDDDLLVVYKERNVFSIRTQDKKTYSHNLYHYLYEYLKRKNERPYIVHRLDYETSGIVVFAKNESIQTLLRSAFEKREVKREYEAVVKESLECGKTYHVEHYLNDKKNPSKVVITNEQDGRLAITDLEVTNQIQIGSVFHIDIKTGRRNQIRIAIHSLGFTLLGDKRYSSNEAKRMYLNAYRLTFPSSLPINQYCFETQPLWLIENKTNFESIKK